MLRQLLLPIVFFALRSITASCATLEPKPIPRRLLSAFSNVRHLTQACQDQYQECATWAQEGKCDWVLVSNQQSVAVACPASCNNCDNNNGTTLGPSDWLGAHNYYRSLHGVPDLLPDPNLVASAQSYANTLASNCLFQHSQTSGVGENLAAGYADWAASIKGWYDEEALYDYNNPGFSSDTGHFTQVVWKSTDSVGCGFASNANCQMQHYYVCQYTPPGNVEGQFNDNVLPLV